MQGRSQREILDHLIECMRLVKFLLKIKVSISESHLKKYFAVFIILNLLI